MDWYLIFYILQSIMTKTQSSILMIYTDFSFPCCACIYKYIKYIYIYIYIYIKYIYIYMYVYIKYRIVEWKTDKYLLKKDFDVCLLQSYKH